MSNERILIVDDEIELAEILRDFLSADGFITAIASNGEEAIEKFKSFNPDLMILDIMMPKIDGMEVCRILRSQSSIPILMLSSKSTEIDKILGLGLGADDYITKPFSPNEVVARVKAHLRRYIKLSGIEPTQSNVLKYGELQIDSGAYTVKIDGKKIELAAKEFEILLFLAKNPKQVFSKEQLYNQIWGYDDFGDINTVTVHIRKIREKIDINSSKPKFIHTVWGVGYKFDYEGDL